MPKDNFKKTAIRQRMAITDESYSVARRAIEASDWFSDFMLMTGGMKPGLHVVAAEPKSGKTTFLIGVMKRFANNANALYVNAELSSDEISTRMVDLGVGNDVRVLSGGISLGDIADTLRFIRDTGNKTDVVIVDYINLFIPSPSDERYRFALSVDQNVRILSELAAEFEVPIVVALMASREKAREFSTGALSYSGSVEQTGSTVIHLSREEGKKAILFKLIKSRFVPSGAESVMPTSW